MEPSVGPANRREALGIEAPYVPPATAIEVRLGDVWKEVLGLDSVGVDDDFFALGGDSLGLTQVLMEIRQVWSVDLRIETFFDQPTVRQLAAAVEAAETDAETDAR